MPTPCFWVEKTDRQRWGLRRFVSAARGPSCPAGGDHDALNLVGARKRPPRPVATSDRSRLPAEVRDRKDWPKRCDSCGYRFKATDTWQVWTDRIYQRPETGEEWTLRDLPPGAIFDAEWLHDFWVGEDGLTATVVLPVGEPEEIPWNASRHMWHVDSEATGGGHWTRTGDPRKPETLTVSPSIAKLKAGVPGYYHGFLQDGVLTDHIG